MSCPTVFTRQYFLPAASPVDKSICLWPSLDTLFGQLLLDELSHPDNFEMHHPPFSRQAANDWWVRGHKPLSPSFKAEQLYSATYILECPWIRPRLKVTWGHVLLPLLPYRLLSRESLNKLYASKSVSGYASRKLDLRQCSWEAQYIKQIKELFNLYLGGGQGMVTVWFSWIYGAQWWNSPENSLEIIQQIESESCLVMSDSLWPHGLYHPWNSPGQNTGVGSLFLFQGIFPIQELNQGLLHCRHILCQLTYWGSPQQIEERT